MIAVIVILSLIVLFTLVILIGGSIERANDEQARDKYLKNTGIKISEEYEYKNVYNEGTVIRFIVDETHKKLYISQNRPTFDIIDFSEITGCDVLVDSQVAGGLGRAIVGGVIAGTAGALAGFATAKPHIMSYKIVIYRQSTTDYIIQLINKKTSTNDPVCSEAVTFANKVNSEISAIILNNRQ